MCFFDFFKPKKKAKSTFVHEVDAKDDYQLPVLSRASIQMTADLLQRQQDEQLQKKYGICAEKEGHFV